MKKLLCILSLFALLLASCSKSSSPTSTNTNNNNTATAPQDSMIVTVDGVNYRWYAAGTSLNGSVSVQGYLGDRNVTVNLSNITQPGTYDVGVYTGTGSSRTGVSMTSQYKNTSGQIVSYYSPVTGGSVGKVTIEEITSTTCKASFNGTLTIFASIAGAPPTTVITNGSVNAKLVP